MGEAEAQEDVAQDRGEARHIPHASNATNAACGSCFNLNTVCFDKPSTVAMADRLGGLALSRASLMRSNVALS
jgi:hypothetical protein